MSCGWRINEISTRLKKKSYFFYRKFGNVDEKKKFSIHVNCGFLFHGDVQRKPCSLKKKSNQGKNKVNSVK